jgi:hypothetical protein
VINEYESIAEVPSVDWDRLTTSGTSDLNHGYLAFREWLEPGEAVVFTYTEAETVVGGMHAVRTTPRSGLFSHPWKMLADEQFLRTAPDGSDGAVRKEHRALVDAVDWGEVLVVRGFDHSAVLSDDERVIGELVTAARRRSGGALVFPFVDPADTALRNVLRQAGFRQGTLTAVGLFELAGQTDYDRFLTAMPGRFRRHHVKEGKSFAESGLSVREVPLTGRFLEEVVDLEAQNTAKYGGSPDVERLRRARRMLADLVPGGVRVPAVHRDGRMIACGVHLVCSSSYHILGYGCDYSVEDRSSAYQCLTFYDPIRFCIDRGLHQCRLGFEGLAAKYQRGAKVRRREMWMWTDSKSQLSRLNDLLAFIDQRNTDYLSRFGA